MINSKSRVDCLQLVYPTNHNRDVRIFMLTTDYSANEIAIVNKSKYIIFFIQTKFLLDFDLC